VGNEKCEEKKKKKKKNSGQPARLFVVLGKNKHSALVDGDVGLSACPFFVLFFFCD
jgi:predicted nucleic acid-binding Zn finger protein